MTAGRGILLLLVALLAGSCQGQLKPGCKIETLRACGDDYVPYSKHPHLRDFKKEFADGCAKDKQQMACTLNFIKKCVDGLPEKVATVALEALEKTIAATCLVGSEEHKNFEKAIGCMNSVGEKLQKCIGGYKNALERTAVKIPEKDALKYTCCHYHGMTDCLSSALVPCENVGAKKIMFDVIEHVFGGTLSKGCEEYTKGSQGCKQLPALPSLGSKDRRIPNFTELLIELAVTIGKNL